MTNALGLNEKEALPLETDSTIYESMMKAQMR